MPNISQSTLGLVRDALELVSPEADEFSAYTVQQFWKKKLFDSGFPPSFIGTASSAYSFDWTEIMLDLCGGKFGGSPPHFCDLILKRLVVLALAESKELGSDIELRQALETDQFDFSNSTEWEKEILANSEASSQRAHPPLSVVKIQPADSSDSVSQSAHAISIFISHSSQDKAIADALTELLKNALEIAPEAIRCTSVEGHGLPVGARASDHLKQEVLGAKSFIALLTPHSLSSTWVLVELGARWGRNLTLFPILGAGLTTKQLSGPLPDIHAISCESDSDLHKLVRTLSGETSTALRAAELYTRYIHNLVELSKHAAKPHFPSNLSKTDQTAAIHLPSVAPKEPKLEPHLIRLPTRTAWIQIEEFCYRERESAFTRAVIAVYENEVQDKKKIGAVQDVAGKITYSDENGQEFSELRVNQGCWINAGNEVNFPPNTRQELIVAIWSRSSYQVIREINKYSSVYNTKFEHQRLFVTVQLVSGNEVLRTDRYLLTAMEKDFSLVSL